MSDNEEGPAPREWFHLGILGICCHDADSRALQTWIDTDAPAAREWALSVFERYRDETEPANESDMDAPIP